jgi:hypothetical protein
MDTVSGIRSFALNSTLFLSLLLSHHIGGGDFNLSPFLLFVFIPSFLLFLVRPVSSIRGPFLAMLLLFIQFLGHFELSPNMNVPILRMSLAHIAGMVVGYAVSCDFDRRFNALVELLHSFFAAPFLVVNNSIIEFNEIFIFGTDSVAVSRFFNNVRKRGPPSFAVH